MTKRSFVGAVILGLIIIPSAMAQVSGVKAKDPALQAAIEARQKAVDTQNTAEWSKLTSEDFVRINADGSFRSRAEQIKALTASTVQPVPTVIDRIQMFGPDAAVATQRNQSAGSGSTRVTLFWVRQAGTWRVAATVFTPNTAK
jgi:hypothetical protein